MRHASPDGTGLAGRLYELIDVLLRVQVKLAVGALREPVQELASLDAKEIDSWPLTDAEGYVLVTHSLAAQQR